jgi:predicted Zn-dependent protease
VGDRGIRRRDLLRGLGAASASAVLWAMGCRAPERETIGASRAADDVPAWLIDAVARIATAFPAQATTASAIAVSRTRATAAIDVLGRGVSRGRSESVVLRVHGADGMWREQVTGDLSRAGVDAAATLLAGHVARRGTFDFGLPAQLPPQPLGASDPLVLHDLDLLDRVDALANADAAVSSRIVYAANVLDIDDATVWTVALGRQRAQRLTRVRRSVTRVAWNGTRPAVRELARGWRGGVDDQVFEAAAIQEVSDSALALMTPGELADGDYEVELTPAVVAAVIDATARGLLTAGAAERPEVAQRLAIGATMASPLLTLVDDPAGDETSYGGFAFDDEGIDATVVKLLDAGRVVGRLGAGNAQRPGHVGVLEAAPSHLRLAPGTGARGKLIADGLAIDGAQGCVIDPSSDRVVISARRADALHAGDATGRKWGDVEIVGELGALLAAVNAVSAETETVPLRDETEGALPRWRSIEAPALATHAYVRARRRPT